MLELWWAESVNIDVRIFLPDVMQEIDIPVEPELGMVSALHQNLHTAGGAQLVEFRIELFEGNDVMIRIFFRAIKRAEFAINVADIGVVDVAIDDVGDDLL